MLAQNTYSLFGKLMKNKNKIKYQEITTKMVSSSYLSLFINKIAAYIVYLAQDLPLTPNLISLISLISAILAVIGLAVLKSPFIFIIGISLSFIFDDMDGIWARAKNQTSFFGAFIDEYFDYVKEFLFEIGIVIYFVHIYGFYFLPFSFYVCYFSIKGLYYLILDQQVQIKKRQEKWTIVKIGPAEKYLIVMPIIVYFNYLIPIYFLGIFILYIFYIALTIRSRYKT